MAEPTAEKADFDSSYNVQVGYGREPVIAPGRFLGLDDATRRRRRIRKFAHFGLLSLLILNVTRWSMLKNQSNGNTGLNEIIDAQFNWSAVEPSKDLQWQKCYNDFDCARLSVPLDYSEPDGSKAAVALVRYQEGLAAPALHWFWEPANFYKASSDSSSTSLDFDPRVRNHTSFNCEGAKAYLGVGLTTPSFHAFPTKNDAGKFLLEYPMNINKSFDALGKAHAYSGFLGNMVEAKWKNITEHVSTPTVATDMLTISKAMGYDKLQYWGFSYGTILGATFAAMYPDNVGRVIIDGVADSEDYYSGAWSNNLRDTDAALLDLYQACVDAGPDSCPIYENSTELVQKRVKKLLTSMKTAPIPVYYEADERYPQPIYGVADFESLKSLLFSVLYSTHSVGKYAIDIIAGLEMGFALPLLQLSNKRMADFLLSCDCPAPGHEPPPFYGLYEHTLAIACGDSALEDESESFDELKQVYDDMAETSTFADTWWIHAACSGWKVKAKDRFQGSFKHNTSYPLLLIGKTADPVTPLWNANKMSEGFNGSVVLTQDSSGHCSISATSLCTARAIRAYFQNGTLPEKGTICDVESKIFDDELSVDFASLSSEDHSLLMASQELQRRYFVPILTRSLQMNRVIPDMSGEVQWTHATA